MFKKTSIIWYLLTIIPIFLIALGYLYPSSFFSNQDKLRQFITSYGAFAPLVFVLINILQVVITPISHYVVGFLGGFIFGTWQGFLYNWIGRVVGSLIAFYLGRKFGRKILKHVVKDETIQKYDKVFDKGKILLFLMYFLPLFPDDELSYLAGFSSMSPKAYIPIMMLGHIGGSLGLAFLGSGLSYKDPLFIGLSVITIIAGILFAIFYQKFKLLNNGE